MRAMFGRTSSSAIAFSAPDLLAPEDFRAHIKKLDNRLDCWWSPSGVRQVVHKGKLYNIPGCWVIWHRVTVAERVEGLPMRVLREWWAGVYQLNGQHGLPTELGTWVTHVLKASDMTKRGNQRRREELNSAAYDTVMKEQVENERRQDELLRDRLWKKVVSEMNDKMGVSSKSGDDRKRYAREEDQRRKRYEKESVSKANEMKIFGGGS